MAKFIQLLDKNDRNTLINVEHISSIVIFKDPEEEVRIYQTGDTGNFLTVKESFAELRQKLETVSEVIDLR